VTDIVIQNRTPGDEPVSDFAFSRLFIGPFKQNKDQDRVDQDLVLTAVGNQTVNVHLSTGLEAEPFPFFFRVLNAGNSTAPFCEVAVTGLLTRIQDRTDGGH
jgi:hypothetical protein